MGCFLARVVDAVGEGNMSGVEELKEASTSCPRAI
jgi:hypothetical protein